MDLCFIWGGKSKTRLALPYLQKMGLKPAYIYDAFIDGSPDFSFDGEFLDKSADWEQHAKKCSRYFLGIGGEHGKRRAEIGEILERDLNLKPISIINERAYICPSATHGKGCMFMPGAVLHSYSVIGDHCIVNTNAAVDHECIIGNGVHIMGGANVTGRVQIGDYVTIGTNASILPDLSIGEGAFIGAGAVVTKDVAPYQTVIGVPARPYSKSQV